MRCVSGIDLLRGFTKIIFDRQREHAPDDVKILRHPCLSTMAASHYATFSVSGIGSGGRRRDGSAR